MSFQRGLLQVLRSPPYHGDLGEGGPGGPGGGVARKIRVAKASVVRVYLILIRVHNYPSPTQP